MSVPQKNTVNKSERSANKLFVYGTLRNDYGHKLYSLLKDNFELIGKGVIKGKLFDIGKYPGAIISNADNNKIVGEIYQVKDAACIDSVFKVLDKYEGYDVNDKFSSEYIRKRKLVKLKNGKKVLSWVYIYNKPIANKHLIESGDYINHISKKKAP